MKRLRSSDDLDSYGKDPNPSPHPSRSSLSAHRSFYYKSETSAAAARKGLLSSTTTSSASASAARYDRERLADEDRDGARAVRKRAGDHDFDGFDRRKGFDKYRDGGGESRGYDRNLIHRSESFCGSRREFPKGFRSERDRSRREGSVSSWRRFGSAGKELDEGGGGGGAGSRCRLEERGKGLRDVRSPTWSNSKDSGSEQSRVRSPARGLRDARSISSMSKSKSPTWSKDSVGSEQSKSVEVKKGGSEEAQVESNCSSEMEEGELEPEPEAKLGKEAAEPQPQPEPQPKSEARAGAGAGDESEAAKVAEGEAETAEARVEEESGDAAGKETESERPVEDNVKTAMEDKDELLSKEEVGGGKSLSKEEEVDDPNGERREEKDVEEQVDEVQKSENNLNGETHASDKSGIGAEADKEDGKEEEEDAEHDDEGQESGKDASEQEDKMQMEMECKQDKGIDLEVEAEDVEGVGGLDMEVMEENGAPKEEDMTKETDSLAQSFKDKGKSLAVTPPTHIGDSTEDGVWVEREARDLLTTRDSDMEGPSIRGFDLFTRSPVRRQEKAEQGDEQPALVPLDLSLSLPNVLLPVGAVPGSPTQARSVQSLSNTFRTNSDGFTASMSFSGSQSFYHNPSCSLTQNSMDNLEQSVKSRPIFQGIDWQALSQSESKQKEAPLYQRILMNGSGSNQQSQGLSNGQSVQGQHPKITEGSTKLTSLHKQLSGGQSRHNDDVRSPSHSVGSHEMGSNYRIDRKRVMREKSSGSLHRSSSLKEHEQFLIGGADFVETVIARIVSEPIHAMAGKFHEMTGQNIACLKESIREILLNVDKRAQISAIQKALQDRSDINLEMLLKSHRAQLEILVALKTALPDFLQQANSVSSTDLAEIFLNLRCRNIACRNPVPVDECDCKVCVQKNGFCSSCMCLLCAKFDMASNTCSWVGCDVCLHWCHTDCGLRESYIRNGRSATGAQATSEMQFHCVACDHPSELFGFVKEVFQNFAKEWTAETFSMELEYVKRIFAASKDLRGKRLHEIAGQMLARLASKVDLPEVYSHVMAFLTGNISIFFS